MRLEQVIRSTMTEAADMDGRLDQLVRAGLMPTSMLPILKRALSRMHAGMSLQGAERDAMNMFINSMMFIVLGDDTVFTRARTGAKATYQQTREEVEDLGETAKIVAHLTKRYGDNIRKSHVMSAAKDFGVDPSKLSKAVRKKLGKSMLGEAEDKQEYDYEGDMAMGQLKSIIANSQRMHDMLSDDTNLPEWVQSKITLAEDYISTASNYMQGEMNEEKMPFEGPYRKVGDRKDKYGNPIKNIAKHLAKKAMNDLAKKNEEVEELDELSIGTMKSYGDKRARTAFSGGRKPGQSVDAGIKMKSKQSNSLSLARTKINRARDTGSTVLNKEEIEQVDEISKAMAGRYINKAKDSIDMTSYRSGIKDGTAISSSTPYKSNNPLEKKLSKRHKGIETAVKKLTKEDIDAVKKMNESYKTAFQTALNEYGIKSPSELDESKRKEFFNHVDLEFKKGDK